jgi:signal transduction histidine kinase
MAVWSGHEARRRGREAGIAAGRGLLLALLALFAGLPLFISTVVAYSCCAAAFIGVLISPSVTRGVRALADGQRHRSLAWSGVRVPSPYRPAPDTSGVGAVRARWRVLRWIWTDPATWRDLVWLLANVPVGLGLGLLPAYLLYLCAQGVLAIPLLALTGGATYWWIALGLGACGFALAPFAGKWILKGHALFSAGLLAPSTQALTARVGALAESRTQVLDSSAAELRRIERDLHDGAQTRLAALGLHIGLAEQLVREDPDAAVALLAEARASSGEALAELRGLVRGIHPPVLAERGLDGAIRALSLTVPLPVELDIELPARLPAPIESALYFAVAEAFANAVKHSGARQLEVRLRQYVPGTRGEPALLIASVRDDGAGGARLRAGGGLDGIGQRLAAFDGGLVVHSPAGGPTVLTMELPCASS